MRVIIFEDEIDGEVQDGTVDLAKELSITMEDVGRWTMFRSHEFMRDDMIADGAYDKCRADASWKSEKKQFRIEFKATLNPEEKEFVFTTTMVVDFYKEYVRVLHERFPELFAYPRNLLETWSVQLDDVDIYTDDSLVSVESYMSAEFSNRLKTPVDLYTFLHNQEYMTNKTTLPFAPRFDEGFRAEFLKIRKKMKLLSTRASTGTFKGRKYELDKSSINLNIYISKRTYTIADGVIHPKFQASITIGGYKVKLDGQKYNLYSNMFEERAPRDILIYFKELSDHLKEFFLSFNIEFKILMDEIKPEETENPEQ